MYDVSTLAMVQGEISFGDGPILPGHIGSDYRTKFA